MKSKGEPAASRIGPFVDVRKQTAFFVTSIIVSIVVFIALSFLITRSVLKRHEEMFLQQQKLHVFLARQAIEDRIGWMYSESTILANHSLPEFAMGKRNLESLRNLFLIEQASYPEMVAHAFLDTPDHVVHTRSTETPHGLEAGRLIKTWVRRDWDSIKTGTYRPFVPVFHITQQEQMFGMLYPVMTGRVFHGVLAIVVDLQPMIQRYIASMRTGRYGAAYLLDERGTVVYDHETLIIGRNVFDGMHNRYPALIRLDKRLIGEASGTAEYEFTVERDERKSRKLIAWDSVPVGERKLIVCLSAPDIEINKTLYGMQMQRIVLGSFFSVVILFISGLFFFSRQRMLKKSSELLQVLVEQKEKYLTLFETANDGIFILKDSLFIDMNSKTLELFGYEKEQMLNHSPHEFSPENQPDGLNSREKSLAKIDSVLRGEPQFFEWRHEKKGGIPFDVEISLNRINIAGEVFLQAIVRDVTERKNTQEERERLIHELREALAEINTLSGLLPICGYCKKIRDDKGYWQQIETYIETYSNAQFTHGMCNECFKKHQPALYEKMLKKGEIEP